MNYPYTIPATTETDTHFQRIETIDDLPPYFYFKTLTNTYVLVKRHLDPTVNDIGFYLTSVEYHSYCLDNDMYALTSPVTVLPVDRAQLIPITSFSNIYDGDTFYIYSGGPTAILCKKDNHQIVDMRDGSRNFTFTPSQFFYLRDEVKVPNTTGPNLCSEIGIQYHDQVATTGVTLDGLHRAHDALRGQSITISTPSERNHVFDAAYLYADSISPQVHIDLAADMSAEKEPTPDVLWSDSRTVYLDFTRDYLIPQIRTRYAMLDRPSSGSSNIIVDSYAPKLLCEAELHSVPIAHLAESLPKTSVAISPWFANMLGVKQMSTEQMCRILGYTKKKIRKLMMKVKDLEYTAAFIGYGGTGVNTIHWLTEMSKMTHTVNLFNHMRIYEPDNAEVSNLLRFPKDPTQVRTFPSDIRRARQRSKLRLLSLDELSILSRQTPSVIARRHSIGSSEYRSGVPVDKHFMYGAPGIAYRTRLSERGSFISATHAGNTCSLHLNPLQDTDLQVESYGVIQLAPFFMNQLRMAIGLLEYLATNPDMSLKNQELLEYSFNGESVLSTDRSYKFQLDHSGLLSTEQEV